MEVARRLRSTEWAARATLIAVTGWGQERDKERAAAAGFDHHLTKPVDPAALESLLRAIIPAHQAASRSRLRAIEGTRSLLPYRFTLLNGPF